MTSASPEDGDRRARGSHGGRGDRDRGRVRQALEQGLAQAQAVGDGSPGDDDRARSWPPWECSVRLSGCGASGSSPATGRRSLWPPDRSSPGGGARRRHKRSVRRGADRGCHGSGRADREAARSARSGTASPGGAAGRACPGPRPPRAGRPGGSLGSRSRVLTNSTYQSQNSPQVKSRSRLVASANRNASRSVVVSAIVSSSPARIQRSSMGRASSASGPGL